MGSSLRLTPRDTLLARKANRFFRRSSREHPTGLIILQSRVNLKQFKALQTTLMPLLNFRP